MGQGFKVITDLKSWLQTLAPNHQEWLGGPCLRWCLHCSCSSRSFMSYTISSLLVERTGNLPCVNTTVLLCINFPNTRSILVRSFPKQFNTSWCYCINWCIGIHNNVQIHNNVLWDWQYFAGYSPHSNWMWRIFLRILSVPQTLFWIWIMLCFIIQHWYWTWYGLSNPSCDTRLVWSFRPVPVGS